VHARTSGAVEFGNPWKNASGDYEDDSPILTHTLEGSQRSRLHPLILTVKAPTPSIYAAYAAAFNSLSHPPPKTTI
jgi:hypothetical protein